MSLQYDPQTRRYRPSTEPPRQNHSGYPDPKWVGEQVERHTASIMRNIPAATPAGPMRRSRMSQTQAQAQTPEHDFPEETNVTTSPVPAILNGSDEPTEFQEVGGLTLDADWYMARTQEYLDWVDEAGRPEAIFPQGRRAGIYPKDLLGVPFIITSEFRYSMSRPRADSKFKPREQGQCMIRYFDPSTRHFSDARLATLNGSYLLNQTRSIPPDMLIGGMIWTVAPNPYMDLLPSSSPDSPQYPKMLKPWETDDFTSEEEEDEPEPVPVARPQRQRGSQSAIAPHYPEIPSEAPVGPAKRGPGRPKGSTNRNK